MEFTFHLFVQKHANRTYTVTPLPFFDLTVYGINLDDIKHDLAETLAERIKEIPARNLHSVIRTYALDRADRYIRDMRTDVRLSNVKDVLNKGLLDEFILAYLENKEAQVTWEDRFPRTFPF
jgi:hypothetical protein